MTAELVAQGFTRDEIARRRRVGELRSVRRGAYLNRGADATDAAERHRWLIAATMPQLRAEGALSYTSAAVVHGLPVWSGDLGLLHLTRPRVAGGGKNRGLVRLHAQPLTDADLTEIDGLAVTAIERTVFDIARTLPFERAVAAGDHALASGMSAELLAEMIERRKRWKGSGRARRAAAFLDGRAESAGESVSRVRCLEFGLPAPHPQLPVALANGATVFGDLGWDEFRTIGEFDGRIKYEKLLQPGESASDVVVREKRREDAMRSLGWQVVRWVWEDLWRFHPVHQQLLAAFERGRRSTAIAQPLGTVTARRTL